MDRELILDGCTLDLRRGVARRVGGEEVGLTAIEAQLLRYLARRAGQPVARGELLTQVWGYHDGARTKTLAVTVRRVRQKIESDPSRPRHLQTVRGFGYRLDALDGQALVGRREELEALRIALARGETISLVGIPGVGRRTLARAATAAAVPIDSRPTTTRVLVIRPLTHAAGIILFTRAAGVRRTDAVGELVAALDAFPLALRIAASRVRVLSPQAQVERAHDDPLRLLVSRDRSLPYPSMRAALDQWWSELDDSGRAVAAGDDSDALDALGALGRDGRGLRLVRAYTDTRARP